MEFAVQWVPEQKDMDYVGMVNKGACRMLLSKLYMSIGEFGKAKNQKQDCCKQKHQTNSNYSFYHFHVCIPLIWENPFS